MALLCIDCKRATDGYTIFNYGICQSIAPALHKNLPYHHLRDFTLISTFAMTANLLTVTPSLGIANVQEFISAAKANAGKFKYATNGVGGTPQNYVAKIYTAMMNALAMPELKQRFFENGVAAAPMTPGEFTQFINVETAKWQRAVAVSGLKSE